MSAIRIETAVTRIRFQTCTILSVSGRNLCAVFRRLISPFNWTPSHCLSTSDVVSFDGDDSALVYRLSSRLRRTTREVVSLKFKTLRNSGTLLSAGGQRGLSLSLELERGKLQLLLRQGGTLSSEPQQLASLGSLLDDQHWHHVVLERRGAHLNLTVDERTEKVQIPAEFNHWDVEQGNLTFSCAETVSIAVTFPGPHSFLQLPGPMTSASGGFSIRFQFRTWNKAGLLLTFGLPQQTGTVWLHLSEARLQLQIHKDGRALLELRAGSALNDGQWHLVDFTSRRGRLSIALDKEEGGVAHASPSFPIRTGRQLFFGGCPAEDNDPGCRNPFDSFQGCMRLLSVDEKAVDLITVQQRLLGNYSQLQIDMCGIIDRCSPSRCEHGGRCSQTWTVFHCNCSDSGYSGATCHSCVNQHSVHFDYSSQEEQLSAVISQSEHCEQELSYHCRKSRLLNTPEGSPFSWWLGGPGPGHLQTYWGGAHPGSQQCACGLQGDCVDPQHYCNCDADRADWAEDSGMLTHKENLPIRSLVLGDVQRPGSEAAYHVGPLRCHGDKNFWNAAFFDKETSYLHFPTFHGELSADISFLFKTTASSELGLMKGATVSENLGKLSELEGNSGRERHLKEKCDLLFVLEMLHRLHLWQQLFKMLNPSTQVVFSFDVGNGPLEVHVESSVPLNDNRWHRVRAERNVKEAVLRLDGLPAATQEAPADGHFYLQLNSQLFIVSPRLEHVARIFVLMLRQQSSTLMLTENRTSVIFIITFKFSRSCHTCDSGGTASRQKGFRGCIRSLQLNGVTLDLEERAKITPGVRPGCPGHCSSYGSLCQNQGRCVERASGFQCDCGLSAHTGVFCHTVCYRLVDCSVLPATPADCFWVEEVSASFQSGTSVSYTFKEPYELIRNSSALPSSVHSDGALRGENVSLSFRTSQSPALLLYVSSYSTEYLALLINKNDKLELRYKLDSSREADVLRSSVRSLANGQLHFVTIRRRTDSVSVQVDDNPREDFNLTFDGEFNDIKSVVLGKVYDNSPVVVTGPLVQSNCGSLASANPYAAEDTHHLSDQSGSMGSGQPLVNAIRTDSALIGVLYAVSCLSTVFIRVEMKADVSRYREKIWLKFIPGNQGAENCALHRLADPLFDVNDKRMFAKGLDPKSGTQKDADVTGRPGGLFGASMSSFRETCEKLCTGKMCK
ncbi:Contactin-associated protein-like 4 Cell recognition molecule Caspr4 Precursor [Channa argus]|uniref:Contactin-associated protein-like 4 Cell recognition molecule Caspr4 n=1 Tax=Channa argus TaxID=215402 RepID=A0A6G1Q7T2_CHAAH|nr:Contactin-associated protein-like 4 Cell recognition molecule Caspr4 Precursor [Channa argus]